MILFDAATDAVYDALYDRLGRDRAEALAARTDLAVTGAVCTVTYYAHEAAGHLDTAACALADQVDALDSRLASQAYFRGPVGLASYGAFLATNAAARQTGRLYRITGEAWRRAVAEHHSHLAMFADLRAIRARLAGA